MQGNRALDYERQAALEGQLREAEFLAPAARTGGSVRLIGDLWVRDKRPDDEEALRLLMLGGERGYGWGRVKLDSLSRAGEKTIADYTWQEKNGQVLVHLPKEQYLTAHALAAGEGAVPYPGAGGAVGRVGERRKGLPSHPTRQGFL